MGNSEDDSDRVFYGELAILGFNGGTYKLPRGRQAKIALYKRDVANAVRPGTSKRIMDRQHSKDTQSSSQHRVTYTLTRNNTIVVEYVPDPDMDMFQIGRSTDSHIDFVVTEPCALACPPPHARIPPNPGAATPAPMNSGCRITTRVHSRHHTRQHQSPETPDAASHQVPAVSRFACRICIERNPPHTARIYAAGFNTSNNIFLGELAVKWTESDTMDGLTTNGVMIYRANPDQICAQEPNPEPNVHNNNNSTNRALLDWREVSICGSIYKMRNNRWIPNKHHRVNEDNVLQDKTLIDLCGVTLIWRSAEGLRHTASPRDLKMMVDRFNRTRFQCPVLYETLRMPSIREWSGQLVPHSSEAAGSSSPSHATHLNLAMKGSKPHVYLKCGHVHGSHDWRALDDIFECDSNSTCPMCRQRSPFVPLRMGMESAFYIDRGLPTHCFNPCGHMASEQTCRYWCTVRLPNNYNFAFEPRCPFCLTAIASTPVQLRFEIAEEGYEWLKDLTSELSQTTLHDQVV